MIAPRIIVVDARKVNADPRRLIAALDDTAYARVVHDDSMYTGGITIAVLAASTKHAMGLVAGAMGRVT